MEALQGKRILVLEEQSEVAAFLDEVLTQMGCDTIGPVSDPAQALSLLRSEQIDAAIIDVKIRGEATLPVADELARMAVPFAVTSGNSAKQIRNRHPMALFIRKPYSAGQIADTLARLFG